MNIFEAIGIGFVIFMACIGTYTVGRLVYEGLKAFTGKVDIGRSYEDAAIRDHLVLGAEGKGR